MERTTGIARTARTRWAKWIAAASFVALSGGVAGLTAAQAAGELPAAQRVGGVEVLTGGVGHDEARAMELEARRWPLALEFAVKDGPHAEFAANVAVHVRDARNRSVLESTASGPFLLARLAPGDYKVDATLRGHTLQREVHVSAGQTAHVLLLWPQGVDIAAP
ncbi:carboxypeptidase-like regulatory domain-containing protein [Azohydromonas lata]|uniref:carboxypeptidase-like regulatory domain-containing protein n=1 Tax=Azohydromonas lata TaxID=45677 RepID=UPI0012F4B5B3|nr:carboxypeptidase-like regulatory domain-containing protein [Azohydromonas lata]